VKAPPKPAQLTPDEIEFIRGRVIFEDAAVLAFDKPAGLSSQGGRIAAHTLDDLLWAFAKRDHARPRLVHRLDRDTSGVLLTARTKPAAAYLGKALMAHRFRKTYLAILAAAPEPKGGVIDQPLRRHSIGREVSMKPCPPDHPEAEAAVTRYRTLAANGAAALVELSPQTGRMHQLRAHLASIGRPILGDSRYGGALMFRGEPVARLMLHAARLGFPHPDSGAQAYVEAPLPNDMLAVLGQAGLAVPEPDVPPPRR
jgi:tRNA pseudouridine32 synthase/23S rRNA pseudouridine746 synthase